MFKGILAKYINLKLIYGALKTHQRTATDLVHPFQIRIDLLVNSAT